MGKRHLSEVAGIRSTFGRPISKTRKHTVNGDMIVVHATKTIRHRRRAKRLTRFHANEYELTLSGQRLQNCYGTSGERHAMLSRSFHAWSRNDPHRVIKVNLRPHSTQRLAGADA